MEIINPNEVLSVESDDPIIVLIIDIDPNYFERYYDDAKDTFIIQIHQMIMHRKPRNMS